MIQMIDDTNVNSDQWGFTEFRFCNPPVNGYKEWIYSIGLPYDFIKHGDLDSSYVGSIHITLSGECNFTLENLVIFYLAEKFGYEVVFHGHKNLLPLFSLISHRAIVFDTQNLSDINILSKEDINYFNSIGAQKKFPETFCSWGYDIKKHYNNDLAAESGITINRPDRLISPFVKNNFYVYDGHLVGPPSMVYSEIIEKCEYFPTTEELVEFYSNRNIVVLKSVWDLCSSIENENPYWENGKRFWIEYKDGEEEQYEDNKLAGLFDWSYTKISIIDEEKLMELIGNNYVKGSLVTEGKKMQYWLWKNYSYAFLTYQLYCSLVLKMQFCTSFGSSNLFAMIPQLNVFSSWVEDPVFPKIMNFKKIINEKLFGHKSFVGHFRESYQFSHDNFIEKTINEIRIPK